MSIVSHMSRHLKTLTITFAIVCSFGTFVHRADAAEYNVYAAFQDFTWKEFVDGQRVVKESGPLFGAGFIFRKEFDNHITLQPSVEIFGGNVDYTGQACDPVTNICVPATSTVAYFGVKAKAEVGGRFSLSRTTFLEPFTGIGVSAWSRDISNGTTSNGGPTQGYTEDWLTLNALLGIRADHSVSSKNKLFAEIGVKLPLYNQNTAYVSNIGQGPDITLNPGKQAAFFAEFGMSVSRIKASLFYDSLRFPQSETKTNGVIAAYQPKSTMDLYGIRIGYKF